MIHRSAPTAWTKWEGPLRPRAYDLNKWNQEKNCPFKTDLFLHNRHTQLRWWQVSKSMTHLARNGDGDQLCLFIKGALICFVIMVI